MVDTWNLSSRVTKTKYRVLCARLLECLDPHHQSPRPAAHLRRCPAPQKIFWIFMLNDWFWKLSPAFRARFNFCMTMIWLLPFELLKGKMSRAISILSYACWINSMRSIQCDWSRLVWLNDSMQWLNWFDWIDAIESNRTLPGLCAQRFIRGGQDKVSLPGLDVRGIVYKDISS